jgi:formylmethanofuran dehydrogenase subunit D
MPSTRYLLIPIRSSKQGVQVNVGKEGTEYQTLVNRLTMHPEDMQAEGFVAGQRLRVRTHHGEADFICEPGNVPRGLLFVPYGPPTCRLMGGDTDGTGMPTSKGWAVELQPADPENSPVLENSPASNAADF